MLRKEEALSDIWWHLHIKKVVHKPQAIGHFRMWMKSNFYMKRWAPGLALKKRPKVIRKWSIEKVITRANHPRTLHFPQSREMEVNPSQGHHNSVPLVFINTPRWRETTWREVTCPWTQDALKGEYSTMLTSSKTHRHRTELTSISFHITVYFEWKSCAFWVDPVLPVVLCIGGFPDVLARDSREVRRWAFFNW